MLVADIDPLYRDFFELRAQGSDPDRELNLNADDVTFVLNTLDELAGDDRFIEIRKRRPQHRVLSRIEDRMDSAREASIQNRKKYNEEFDQAIAKAQQVLNEKVDELKKSGGDTKSMLQQVAMAQAAGQAKLERRHGRLEEESRQGNRGDRQAIGDGKSARCRTGTSSGPWCCRRFRRCWSVWRCFSIAAPKSAKGSPAARLAV